jgi:hypothetical protein
MAALTSQGWKILLSTVPYKAKSLIQAASDSTDRHKLYGFWFYRYKNADFFIVDKCIMRIQGFGGKTTW